MWLITSPILHVAINALILYALTILQPEIAYSGGLTFFITGGVILGVINLLVKPIIKLLSLPLIFLSGGLVLILINVGVLWFLSYFLQVAEFRDVSIYFPNFSTYVIGAIVFGVINWTSSFLIK